MFTSLAKIIDKATQMEVNYKEEKAAMEQGRKKSGSHIRQGDGSSQTVFAKLSSRLVPTQTLQSHTTGGQRRNRSREMVTGSLASDIFRDLPMAVPQVYNFPVCGIYGKRHNGECRYKIKACLRYGQLNHFVRDCPVRRETQAEPMALQLTVQQARPDDRGVEDRGCGLEQRQNTRQASSRRGPARVFTLNP